MNEVVDLKSVNDGGLYLSPEGLRRVRSVFQKFAAANGQISGHAASQAELAVMGDWDSFDDLYLGIYTINLERRDEVRFPVGQLENHPRYEPHSFLVTELKIDLPKVNVRSSFDASLIDESKVAQLQRFRGSLRDLVRYPMTLHAFGLGCVWLEFAVYATQSKGQRDSLPFLDRDDLRTSPGWKRLRQRFPIAAVDISPIPK